MFVQGKNSGRPAFSAQAGSRPAFFLSSREAAVWRLAYRRASFAGPEKLPGNCRAFFPAWESFRTIVGELSQPGKTSGQLSGLFPSLGKLADNCRETFPAWENVRTIVGELSQPGKKARQLSGRFPRPAKEARQLPGSFSGPEQRQDEYGWRVLDSGKEAIQSRITLRSPALRKAASMRRITGRTPEASVAAGPEFRRAS